MQARLRCADYVSKNSIGKEFFRAVLMATQGEAEKIAFKFKG
jgi:hypothetical protein